MCVYIYIIYIYMCTHVICFLLVYTMYLFFMKFYLQILRPLCPQAASSSKLWALVVPARS